MRELSLVLINTRGTKHEPPSERVGRLALRTPSDRALDGLPMGSMDKELTAAQARPRRSAASTGPSVEVEMAASDEATADPYQPAQLTGTKRKNEQGIRRSLLGIRRSTESPLPPEEVRRLAESEGLPLIVAPTHTGFKGVSMVSSNGKNKTPLFALKINKKHAGSFPTAEQAALAYSRHIGREAAVVEAAAAQEAMARRAAVQTPEGRDLTVAEAEAAAAAEGLTLKRSECSASGFKDVAKAAHGGRFYYKAPPGSIRGWRLGTHGTPQAMALAIARQMRDVAAAAPPSAEAAAEAAVEGAAAEAAVEGAAAEVAVEMEVAAAGAAGACMDDAHQQLTATVPGTATAPGTATVPKASTAPGTAPPAAVASAKRLAATATAAAAAAAKAEAKAERHVAALRAKLQAACEELQTASARALSTATQAAAAVQAAAEEKAAAVAQAIEAAQATGAAAADAERKAQLRDIAIEDVD